MATTLAQTAIATDATSGMPRIGVIRRVTAGLVLAECLMALATIVVVSRFARSMAAFDGESISILPTIAGLVVTVATAAVTIVLWRATGPNAVTFAIAALFAIGHLAIAVVALAGGSLVVGLASSTVFMLASLTAWKYRRIGSVAPDPISG